MSSPWVVLRISGDVAIDQRAQPVLPPLLEAGVNEFAQWWQQKQRTADIADKIVRPLYHYTDADGLKGIVENEEIWLTSVLHLNDPSEVNYGIDAARQDLNALIT